MSQRPPKPLNRQISPRSPQIHRPKNNLNYIYSPRTKMRTPYRKYSPDLPTKRKYQLSSSIYPSEKKAKSSKKNQENVNWMTTLGDNNFPSQSKQTNSSISVPPSAFLLFPSPTSPQTRTPNTLRQIIDDSGFKILRESPLSAKDSYYAKDIVDNNSGINSEKSSPRSYSMKYNTNKSKEEASKTFITNNMAKNERSQRSEQEINFKLNNLNDNSNVNNNLNITNPKNDDNADINTILSQPPQRDTASQKKKRADFEKLFDMSDFNLDKFNVSNLDLNDDLELEDLNVDDIKTELSEEIKPNISSSNQDQNKNTDKSNKTPNLKNTKSNKTEQSDLNSIININDNYDISKKTASNTNSSKIKPMDSYNDSEKNSSSSQISEKSISNKNNVYFDSNKNNVYSDSKLTKESQIQKSYNKKDGKIDYNSKSYFDEFLDLKGFDIDLDSKSSDVSSSDFQTDTFDDIITGSLSDYSQLSESEQAMSIDIFGDVSSYLYPHKSKGSNTNSPSFSPQTASPRPDSKNTSSSPFSSYLHPVEPPRSSFKGDNGQPRSQNERKSVKFILPEN